MVKMKDWDGFYKGGIKVNAIKSFFKENGSYI